jgi:hypothetical protein
MATGITLILKDIKPTPMIMESKYYEAGCYKIPRRGSRSYRATRRNEKKIAYRQAKKQNKNEVFSINTEATP